MKRLTMTAGRERHTSKTTVEEVSQSEVSSSYGTVESSRSKDVDQSASTPKPTRAITHNIYRDAMGRYIPPEGQKPLSVVGAEGPGPWGYTPSWDLVKPRSPTVVIGARLGNFFNSDKSIPGPKYQTCGSLTWCKKKFTFGEKGLDYLDRYMMGMSKEASPAKDCVTYGNLGQTDVKTSLKSRHKFAPGLQVLDMQPADIQDFKTPGPNYLPEDKKNRGFVIKPDGRLQKACILRWPKIPPSDEPGPNKYYPEELSTRLPCTLKGKLKSLQRISMPSPDTYTLPSYIGSGPAYSLTSREYRKRKDLLDPGPDHYNLRPLVCSGKTGLKAFFTYRDYGYQYGDKKPGPNVYNRPVINLPKAPVYSLGRGKKDPKPPIGPGPYISLVNDSRFNDGPKWKFGTGKRGTPAQNTPAPNQYVGLNDGNVLLRKNPVYTLKAKNISSSVTYGPGPAKYNIKPKKNIGKTFGMKHWQGDLTAGLPPPNAYDVIGVNLNKHKVGISLKSRHSPLVYSGLASNVHLREPLIVN